MVCSYNVSVKSEEEVHVCQEKMYNIYMYLFILVHDKIVCLVCNKGVSVPKEYSLHYY